MGNALVTRDKDELKEAGHEIQTLLPGGDKLSPNQAIALAKYSQMTDANPFRGEVYGYQNKKGELVLVDGYKQLVRWAERVSKFDDNYILLPVGEEGLEQGDIGYRCTIMRHDKKQQLREYIEMGATFTEAYELVSSSSVGVVRQVETYSKKWEKAIAPPFGWTWDQVARKRALKNALNMAFPMPSPDELASDNAIVDGIETNEEDWEYAATLEADPEKVRSAAGLIAGAREREEERASLTADEKRANLKRNVSLMRDPEDFDPTAEPEVIEGEAEYIDIKEPEPQANLSDDPATQFWSFVKANGIDKQAALGIIHETGGDIDKALDLVQKMEAPPLQQAELAGMPAENQATGYEE